MRKKEQVVSFGGVIALALALPVFLKILNSATRFFAGAEGRLAAIAVETNHPLGPMPQPWRALAQGGEALPDFLDNSTPLVTALAPRYIRIDHIYDQFGVVSRTGSGLNFDWSQLDRLVDKITATGATPFFSLSYMPPAISKGDVVDEPRDWNEWALTVQKTIEHFSGEKGLSGVYYEVWNEPDLFGKWKMGGSKDYKLLYTYAARGAANSRGVRDFKIGGPATTGLYQNWLDNFFPFILENKLRLDFFSWHRYGLDLEKYSQDVASVEKWLDSHPYFAKVEKIITEMGPSSGKTAVYGNRVGAAHLIATTRELLFKIKYGFNFAVKDAAGGLGDWGVISASGQVKPRYLALTLLNRLGNERLGLTGEGTWTRAIAAQKDQVFQVLLVNYDPKGVHSEVVPVSFINLTPGRYLWKQTLLEGGSIQNEVATTAAVLQKEVPLVANSSVLVELIPLDR